MYLPSTALLRQKTWHNNIKQICIILMSFLNTSRFSLKWSGPSFYEAVSWYINIRGMHAHGGLDKTRKKTNNFESKLHQTFRQVCRRHSGRKDHTFFSVNLVQDLRSDSFVVFERNKGSQFPLQKSRISINFLKMIFFIIYLQYNYI